MANISDILLLDVSGVFQSFLGSWIQFQHHNPACSNEEFSAVRFCMHDLGSEPMKKFVLASHCIPSFCVSKCVHIAVKSKITSQDQHHLTQLQYPAIWFPKISKAHRIVRKLISIHISNGSPAPSHSICRCSHEEDPRS